MHASLLGSQPEQPLQTFIQATTPIRAGDEGDATHAAPNSIIESPSAQLAMADTTPFGTPNSDLSRTLAGRIERPRTTGVERGNNARIASRGRRVEQKNYTATEIAMLLDIVEQHEPFGSNMWCAAYEDYRKWAVANEMPTRDQVMMKQKFDRLAKTNKQTGDPTCPPHVRRAKHIARSILARAQAVTIGAYDDDNENEITTENESSSRVFLNSRLSPIGQRRNSSPNGAQGNRRMTARGRQGEELLNCMNRVADTFDSMAASILQPAALSIEELVRNELRLCLKRIRH